MHSRSNPAHGLIVLYDGARIYLNINIMIENPHAMNKLKIIFIYLNKFFMGIIEVTVNSFHPMKTRFLNQRKI